jgi:CysZ protein
VPFLLFAGIGAVLFFLATAWLQGLQYFELTAMRFHSAADAKALRRIHQTTVFIAGLFIAAFVSIPILNLATPLFGTALMVHVYKRLAGPRREMIAPADGANAVKRPP